MKFGLENISRLCAALDHPERRFRSIIVAGTNGKGSVTAMIHHALVAAGHRAGRYTSPHLERLEERYVVGGREATPGDLEAAAEEVRRAAEGLVASGVLTAPPTFFECATAVAFVLFARAGVELAVLEVGLGGRLDATNVVSPIAAVITSIDFDHQAQLGHTLESIAFEKAGVIKPDIPVVCGRLPAAAEAVVRRICEEQPARFVPAVDETAVDETAGTALALRGEHQRANAAVALTAMRELDRLGVGVPHEAQRAGLTAVVWPGRLELLPYRGREVLLDAAHNPAGAAALARYLRGAGWIGSALVIGAMQDKDVAGMVQALAGIFSLAVCTTPDTPRAMPAAVLADIVRRIPRAAQEVVVADAPVAALESACARSPRVVVAGSIFLIGPLRGILRAR